MEVKTYRAKTMQDALELVRSDLGPDAAVLQTREVRRGLIPWLLGGRQVEVTASLTVHVPSRLEPDESARGLRLPEGPAGGDHTAAHGYQPSAARLEAGAAAAVLPPAHEHDYRAKFRDDLKGQLDQLHSLVEELCRRQDRSTQRELPESLFHLFTDLIDAEVPEELAREWIERLRTGATHRDLEDGVLLKARLARMVEEEVRTCGPIQVLPGQRRLVALVGPTGVGKTTTIAKLAANFHLRERCKVGLITVDTYRIAAVEQLRTYADIIDLPMEVVSTPREMRDAVHRLSDLDLILMDTAGRSPRDEVKIQELRTMLAEADADEVHLVLSSVSSLASSRKTAEKFAQVGATSLILTKLDEATGLGNLLPLLRSCQLPLSYVTNGQNVPDDIAAAERRTLARSVLGIEELR